MKSVHHPPQADFTPKGFHPPRVDFSRPTGRISLKKPRLSTRFFLVRVARLARALRAPARTRANQSSPGALVSADAVALFKSRSLLETKKSTARVLFFVWSEWRDLNSRPLDPQSSALPTAPHPDVFLKNTGILSHPKRKINSYFAFFLFFYMCRLIVFIWSVSLKPRPFLPAFPAARTQGYLS